jgi:hypothetical protein
MARGHHGILVATMDLELQLVQGAPLSNDGGVLAVLCTSDALKCPRLLSQGHWRTDSRLCVPRLRTSHQANPHVPHIECAEPLSTTRQPAIDVRGHMAEG